MHEQFEIDNNTGFGYLASNSNVLTFQVQGLAERSELHLREYENLYSKFSADRHTVQLGAYTIPMWGEKHNLYPQEVYASISENKLLPEVIEKQIKFLFGKGPRLYQEEVINQKRIRIPVENQAIQTWLDSWESQAYNHYWEYLRNITMDYYHVKTCVSQYHFTKARRINGKTPVLALSYIPSDEARLATTLQVPLQLKRIKDKDCKHVILGDWLYIGSENFDVYNRFNPSTPFQFNTAIAFNAEKTFTKSVYAFNNWFKGLYEWIKASNLSPKYLNSYLKNALNAHVHVKIPYSWYQVQKGILEGICNTNLHNKVTQTEYKGVKLVNSKGEAIRFNEGMVELLITNELRKITEFMSGEGKNQGKLWASIKTDENGWEFEEFPGKFKEYFDAVISLDKRADQVILAGKGISSSITNVENDGVISKSGSDVYYNYLLYVNSLVLDEFAVCREINRAIQLNFPTEAQGIKLGFWIDIPAKLQDTTPSQRLANTATADPVKTPRQ